MNFDAFRDRLALWGITVGGILSCWLFVECLILLARVIFKSIS
jgi:hypothetical protein